MVRDGESDGSVQVLGKSARILDCFSATTPLLRAADIAAATGMPASTVARILRTLVAENLLQRQGQRYSIGLRVTAWSAAANAGSDLIATAGPIVTALRDRCGESCGVYVRQGESRVSVLQELSTKSIIYRGYIGQVMPLHAGAAGKVFMAFDAEALAAAHSAGLPRFTENTIVESGDLDRELRLVRARGWAYSVEEREPGLNSLAAPIYGPDGGIIAALALGAPAFRLSAVVAKQVAEQVSEHAWMISRGLLWSGDEKATQQ